jgi:hypothetical protein
MRTSLEKNLRPLPRTLDEATRNGDYPYSIHTFKTEWDDAQEFLIAMLFVVPFLAMIFYALYMGLERLG